MKTLTAEQANFLQSCARVPSQGQNKILGDGMRASLCAIASGAHEVIDRATTRGASVEQLERWKRALQRAESGKYDYVLRELAKDALAEIEEALKP